MSLKAKGRILVIIQLTLCFLIILSSYIVGRNSFQHIYPLRITPIAVLAAGVIGMISSAANLRQVFSPNPVPLNNAQLRTTGIYSSIRHPMYLSVMITMSGVILWFEAYPVFFVFAGLVIFFVIKIKFEEKALIGQFPTYESYQKATYKLIPHVY